MVALGEQYQGEESTFEPIPPGEYMMHITSSEMAPTSNGNGRYLKLEMEIIDGPLAGRRITERLNLENPNSKAVEIAQRTLRAIVFAAGMSSCTDSEQLHMRRMLVRVNVEPRNDKPDQMTNRIGGYKQASAGGVNPAPSPSQQSGSGLIAGGGGAPWKRQG